jgi:ABC-2 type transport system ATP-binding protein
VFAAEFNNIRKTYPGFLPGFRGTEALRGVSVKIPTGHIFGLLGPNRAGKTTLVKILLSLCRPTSGETTRLGRPIADRATLARVGYMHENHAFPRYLSASEVLECYGALSLVPQATLSKRIPELLERVGLADRAREPISRFSKGMVQRLGLAQALLNEPDLLLLDEPTEGLDIDGRALLREVVREVKARGRTVILVTHTLPEAEQLCDTAAVLVHGLVRFQGPLQELTASGSRTLERSLRELYEKPAS